MHTPPPFPTPPIPKQDDDGLLGELASLSGLFNPEVIWHEEEQLDNLEAREPAPDDGHDQPAG